MNELMQGQIDLGDQGVQTDPATQMEQTAALEDAINEKNEVEANGSIEESSETVETPENSDDAKFASKFAALSRREKEVRQKESEMEARSTELSRRIEELEAKLNVPEPVEAKPVELPLEYRLRKDPIGVLTEMGIPYEKLTDIVLNDGKLPNDLKMDIMQRDIESKYNDKLQELNDRLDNDTKVREEEKYQTVIQGFMQDLTSFVDADESYEMIKANDSVGLVYEVIEEHYNDTGRILDKKEAADHVEQYLEEEARKFMKLKKFQPVSEVKEPVSQKSQSPTLSNTMSSQVSTSKERIMSDDESKAAVAALLKWDD